MMPAAWDGRPSFDAPLAAVGDQVKGRDDRTEDEQADRDDHGRDVNGDPV